MYSIYEDGQLSSDRRLISCYHLDMKASIIGAAIADLILRPVDKEIFSKGSIAIKEARHTYGGDALNEAVDLARLGNKIKLFTCLGKDKLALEIKNYLKENDVKTYIKEKECSTSQNIVLVDDGGERYFITQDDTSLRALDLEDIDIDQLEGIVSFASVFVSKKLDIAKMTHLFEEIKRHEHILCIDFTKAKNGEKLSMMKEMLKHVDYMFINEEELKMIADDDEPIEKILRYGTKHIIVKEGKDGATLYTKDQKIKNEALDTFVISTSGAGDAFVAGFINGLIKGRSLAECLRLANLAGSLVSSRASNHLKKEDKELFI